MKSIRRKSRVVAVAMIVLTLMTAVPFHSALAALIDTTVILNSANGHDSRDKIKSFMAREDVRAIFIAQGISPEEAQARIDSLTDVEIADISYHIENLPAGGDWIGAVIGILVIVLLIVLIVKIVN